MSYVVPGYLPTDGEEMTAEKIHRMIDTVTINTDAEDAMASAVLSNTVFPVSTITYSPATTQLFKGTDIVAVAHSAASVVSLYQYWGATKVLIGYTPNLDYIMPPAGWLVNMPNMYQQDTMFSGSTVYSLGAYHGLPTLSGKCQRTCLYKVASGGFAMPNFNVVPFVLRTGGGTTARFREFVMRGFTQALVHATLSNCFRPGALFATTWDTVNNAIVPVSFDETNPSNPTCMHNGWGVIRNVYTLSGTTTVSLPGVTGTPAVGFYVAEIFFAGHVCQ